MFSDTHAHLDFPQISAQIEAILERAALAGISRIITIGTSLAGSRRALALAERFPQVWATVGIHPAEVDASSAADLPALRELAHHPRVVAIGEIGLDHHWLPGPTARREKKWREEDAERYEAEDRTLRALQADLFSAQLSLAHDLGLNAVIHQRTAWEDTLSILQPHHRRLRAVYHCFTETAERARALFDLGFLVSFTGIVTFKNTAPLQETIAQAPSGTFMCETDSPYLAPVPHRGQPCEPAYTRLIAEHIARVRQLPLADLAMETEQTANTFFRFH